MANVVADLKKLSAQELEARVVELKTQLVEQKRARAAGELTNPHAIKKTRRSVAVALTLIHEYANAPAKKEEA